MQALLGTPGRRAAKLALRGRAAELSTTKHGGTLFGSSTQQTVTQAINGGTVLVSGAMRAIRTLGWQSSAAAVVRGQAAQAAGAQQQSLVIRRGYALLHMNAAAIGRSVVATPPPPSAMHRHFASVVAALQGTHPGRRFLAFGLPLLAASLASNSRMHTLCFSAPSGAAERHPAVVIGGEVCSETAHGGSGSGTVMGELRNLSRAVYLCALFTPALLLAAPCLWLGWRREFWMWLLCGTLERAGPAFIKWGQWAATRPDMFPPDMCTELERLQTKAPAHSARFSIAAVEAAFGAPIDQMFDSFEEDPVASGSIAQVHRATLSARGARGTSLPPGATVAVKVRHPGVEDLMQRDFQIMEHIAACCAAVPSLAGLRVEDSIRQFGAPLKDQLDLTREADNLARFNHNFRSWRNLSFPRPIFPLVAPGVLVETFEEGVLISKLVHSPDGRDSVHVAVTGMQSYLQMLLKDNFVHADLHPGNILVKPAVLRPEEQLSASLRRLARSVLGLKAQEVQPHVVLLDVGMVAEMSRLDKLAVMDFFNAVSSLDGTKVAESITRFSANVLQPAAQLAFVEDMKAMFEDIDEQRMREYTQEVIGDMLERIRQHGVSIRGTVSTLLVTTMVLEGWSTKLHPDIRILESIKELLPGGWNDRISRLVDKVMLSGEMAVN